MSRAGHWGVGTYQEFAENLARQFERNESVHTGNLKYLQKYSTDSRNAYDWLMTQVADMYGVVPLDAVPEKHGIPRYVSSDTLALGRIATAGVYAYAPSASRHL